MGLGAVPVRGRVVSLVCRTNVGCSCRVFSYADFQRKRPADNSTASLIAMRSTDAGALARGNFTTAPNARSKDKPSGRETSLLILRRHISATLKT
jgi:hypothetical protein